MTGPDPKLDDAYALRTPEDARRYYRAWAESYDSEFAGPQDYRLPFLVADAFRLAGGAGPVLDVGAGTGLVGARLAEHGITPVDGVDISPEMLARAAEKRVYSRLFEGDVTQRLDAPDAIWHGIVSSGTFTLGHVGPAAIDELLRIAAPSALFVLSVNLRHFRAADFDGYLKRIADRISPPELPEVRIYGPSAAPEHRDDRAVLLTFRKL